ncbi:MAG: SDR family NAD(P)-dependent oxidoreductase [Polyangiaceae bacterium]
MPKFERDDFLRATALLEAIAEDRTVLAALDEEARVALLRAAGVVSRPTRHELQRASKPFRRIEAKKKRDADREAIESTGIRAARQADVFVAPAALPPRDAAADAARDSEPAAAMGPELATARACYVCKVEYRRLHHFYDAMCERCGDLNYAKRFQSASLAGRTALITGARVKIGFQAALMMLRAGARVIVTTRFPRDAAARFAREPDFAAFADRLVVYGLDLRHAPSVELFARHLEATEARLDILINNAAQTVRRPPGFYAHLLERETCDISALGDGERHVLRGHEALAARLSEGPARLSSHAGGDGRDATDAAPGAGIVGFRGAGPGLGIRASAALSQVASAYDDPSRDEEHFPDGARDADLQQVDLRLQNSWRLKLAEVPSPEMLEVQLVNAVAPFILCSKLKPLMTRDRTNEKHIVNVSAMEGQFSRGTKTDKHPHTNMAKAALNMMTLTSAPDYAASGIFMNAVDTGWVTDEDPAVHATRKRDALGFQPPLDIVDGAARICDPFFSGLLTGVHVYGKFLKDYAPTSW